MQTEFSSISESPCCRLETCCLDTGLTAAYGDAMSPSPFPQGSEEGGGDFPWGGWKNKALTRAEHWATAAPVRAGGPRWRRSSTSESSRRRAAPGGQGRARVWAPEPGPGLRSSARCLLPPRARGTPRLRLGFIPTRACGLQGKEGETLPPGFRPLGSCRRLAALFRAIPRAVRCARV